MKSSARVIAALFAVSVIFWQPTPAAAFEAGCGYYTNRDGERVPRPCGNARTERAPAGASAICRDGSFSFSRHHSGTCSGHGGVARWR
jgi:hypothetical protein